MRRGGLSSQSCSPLELAGGTANSALRRESQGSLNSSASLDLGYLAFTSSKSEVSQLLGETRCGPRSLTLTPLSGHLHSRSPAPPHPLLDPYGQQLSLLTFFLSSLHWAPCILWVNSSACVCMCG